MIGAGSLLTIAEVSDLLKNAGLEVTPTTVQTLAEYKRIAQIGEGKFVRFTRESVDAYIRETEEAQNGGIEEPPDSPPQSLDRQGVGLTDKKVEVITQDEKPVQKRTVGAKPDNGDGLSDDGKKRRQQMLDDILLMDTETKHINAEIARDEAVKRREKPEYLAKLEKELTLREANIKAKEEMQASRDIAFKEKDAKADKFAIDNRAAIEKLRKDTEAELAEQRKAAQGEIDSLKNEATQDYNALKFDSDNLTIEIDNKQDTLKKIEDKIAEAQKHLDEIAKEAESYLPKIHARAVQHYNVARKSTGAVQVYHDERANKGWDLEENIGQIVEQIKKVLK